MNNRKVSYFVIGAAKCGTTSLYRCLEKHPGIYTLAVKEPRFFAKSFKNGFDWYASLYADAAEGQIFGDYSPNYSNATSLADTRTAELIHAYNPTARLIYMVRNPIACAISNWRMAAEIEGREVPFQEAYEGPWAWWILHRSMFYRQVAVYRQFFDASQMLVVPLELIQADPKPWLTRIQAHLGLPDMLEVFPRSNASNNKPNRPDVPLTTIETRRDFITRIADDTKALLESIGAPPDLWDLSETSKDWLSKKKKSLEDPRCKQADLRP